MLRYFGLVMAIVLVCAGAIRAEPLDWKQVAADAKWVAHADFDAMRASTVAMKANEQFKNYCPEPEKHLAKFREIWKLDPIKDIREITLYDTQIKKGQGVAIVRAKVDPQHLLKLAETAPDHKTTAYGKYELHTWLHAKGTKHARNMTGAFFKPDVLVFGSSVAEVTAALDVLDGKTPSLAGKDSPLAGAVAPGTIFMARAVGLAGADLHAKSPLVKQIESLSLALGENQGEIFLDAKTVVEKPEVAEQLKTVVEGIRAMGDLLHGDDAEATKLLGTLKVSVVDKEIHAEWKAPADAIWAYVQKIQKKIKEKGWPPHGVPWEHPKDKK
jgi:hypothetical protein